MKHSLCRIVIVEDEYYIRMGLVNAVEWRENGFEIVGEAEDGKKGIEIIKETKPDIVITDIRMPIMDGLEMLNTLKSENIEFIILSGYEDFIYAKKALENGVSKYLIKPIDENELLQAVSDIRDKIYKKNSVQYNTSYARKYVINKILAGEQIELGVLCNDSGEMPDTVIMMQYKVGFKNSIEKLEKYDSRNTGVVQLNDHQFVVLHYKKSFDQLKEKYRDYANEYYIGYCIDNIVVDAITNAKKCLDYAILQKQGMICSCDIPKCTSNIFKIQEINTHIDEFLCKGQTFDVSYYICQLFFLQDINLAKNYCIDLIFNIIKYLKELKIDFNSLQIDAVTTIEKLTMISEMQSIVVWIWKQAISLIENAKTVSERKDIRIAIDYIKTHYMENITIEQVASMLFISERYFMRIFKEETGMTFNKFLTEYRIEEAKKLLLTRNLKVYEVSEAVGYKTVKHFVSVFKSITDMTPKEYISRH
ncbi:MAG: response regulator [Oscillospiraceae bacterium]